MTTSLSRMEFGEKKSEMTSVRFTDAQKAFVSSMASLKGMENESEYIRSLVREEMARTASSIKLMADALGVKVITENLVDEEDK